MYNIEWHNVNANRKYPFISTCSMVDTSRKFTLPNSFIVDAIAALSEGWDKDLYLSYIKYTPKEYSLGFSQNGITVMYNTFALSVTAPLVLSQTDGSYVKVSIGTLADMVYGEYYFTDTILEPCKVVKLCQGVSSINGISSGNVVLTSKSNTVITRENNKIYIDTTDGLCNCNHENCLKTINSVVPIDKNINITGVGCVVVASMETGISIANQCEDTCCGCDEINDMLDRINALQARITILEQNL